MTSLIGRCMEATKGGVEGVILYRVGYWDRRNAKSGQDERWSKKSHEEWAEDTGLSVHQVKRGLASLKNQSLIEVGRGLYNGRNVSHVRLSQRGIALFEGCKFALFEQGKSALFYVSENYSDNLSESYSDPDGIAPENSIANETGQGTVSPVKEDKSMKASEVLSKYHADKATKAKTGKIADLSLLFRERWAQNTGKFAPSLSGADVGYLKKFVKECGADRAYEQLDLILSNWISFVGDVKKATGYKTGPNDPSLGYIAKNIGIAINFTTVAAKTEVAEEAPTKFIIQGDEEEIANPLDLL